MHPHATPPLAEAATSQPGPPHGTAARSATNVVVHHLYPRIGDEDLRRAFARFGAVVSATVERDIVTGKSRQMGFVNFATHEAGRAAVAEMHHCKRCGLGKKITVRWASACHNVRERAEERAQSRELFVRNVPLDVTAEQLAGCVAWLGPVVQVRLCGDTVPSETDPRQIAFITFGSAGAAQQALRHLHCQHPFASCGGVPLLCKLREEYVRVRRGSVESDASAQPVASCVASDSSTLALPSTYTHNPYNKTILPPCHSCSSGSSYDNNFDVSLRRFTPLRFLVEQKSQQTALVTSVQPGDGEE